jgi:hypothetical protein
MQTQCMNITAVTVLSVGHLCAQVELQFVFVMYAVCMRKYCDCRIKWITKFLQIHVFSASALTTIKWSFVFQCFCMCLR